MGTNLFQAPFSFAFLSVHSFSFFMILRNNRVAEKENQRFHSDQY